MLYFEFFIHQIRVTFMAELVPKDRKGCLNECRIENVTQTFNFLTDKTEKMFLPNATAFMSRGKKIRRLKQESKET